MANSDNLIPANKRSKEEVRENARKGGINSGKTRRAKKEMRETLNILLDLAVNKGTLANPENVKAFEILKDKNLTVSEAILIAQIKKALDGDIKAAEFIRDTAGQKPAEVKSVKQDVTINNPFSGLSTEELRAILDDE